jgi:hypothetical protein
VGLHKIRYLEAEHGAALKLMQAVKSALDPHNLMNPGKLLPPASAGPAGPEDTAPQSANRQFSVL